LRPAGRQRRDPSGLPTMRKPQPARSAGSSPPPPPPPPPPPGRGGGARAVARSMRVYFFRVWWPTPPNKLGLRPYFSPPRAPGGGGGGGWGGSDPADRAGWAFLIVGRPDGSRRCRPAGHNTPPRRNYRSAELSTMFRLVIMITRILQASLRILARIGSFSGWGGPPGGPGGAPPGGPPVSKA
jgi:hypothetical protein